MSETIFTDNFPLVDTQEELDNLFLKYPNYDQYYIASWSIKDRKEYFDKLWNKFKPYADSDFHIEIKEHFHARSREMAIWKILIDHNFKIDSSDYWPDFIVNNNIYIECVTTDLWDIEPIKSTKKIQIQTPPTDKIILRITSWIYNKIKQYNERENKERFNNKSSYIIAINSWALTRSHNYKYIASPIIQCLFWIQYLRFDKEWNKSLSEKISIIKKNWSEVWLTYFLNNEYNYISWIIFTDDTVLNLEERNCVFINNPFAKNPISESLFSYLDHWKVTKNNDESINLEFVKR